MPTGDPDGAALLAFKSILTVSEASLSGSPVRPRVSRFQQDSRNATGDPILTVSEASLSGSP